MIGGEREIHLRDYLRVIQKRRYTVYTFFIVVFAVVLIGTLSTRPLYQATTKVLIEKGEPRSLMMSYGYVPYDPEFYATQYQLIKSSSVGRKVVDLLDMERTPEAGAKEEVSFFGAFTGWFRDAFASLFGLKAGDRAAREGSAEEREARAGEAAKAISGAIIVKPVKNSKIVEISYLSPNPELAKAVVDAVARAYIDELLELNMSSTRYTLQWMTKKAEEERAKLEVSEKSLQQYMKNQNFVALENKVAIVPQKISELNSQLTRAESRKKEMETLYSRVKDLGGNIEEAETVTAVASDPTIQSLRQQMLKAEQSIRELSQKYGQKHPAMIRATEDLSILRAKKEQEVKRVIESIRNEYELAKSNEANLRRLLAEAKGEAFTVNEKLIEYGVISREVETNRQLYDALIKKIKEQSITEQVQSVNVLIVERADAPKHPVKPRKALNLLIGIIVGLFGGIGMAFFVEYLDQTIRSPEDAEARLNVPVFGMVPLAGTGRAAEETLLSEPASAFAESYKAIRTALLLSTAERPPKRILVTSANPDEGKTATSVNLAIAVAQSERSVLLIDGDLRKPRIHKIFGLDNSRGLSTCLSGLSGTDIVFPGPLPNLGIIPSGPIPPNPSELLSSGRFNELLASLSVQYDIIICDSPPLLTVADSLILGRAFDGTVIVTRSGKTTYELVRRGLSSLASIGGHVLGLVINGVDTRKDDYYHRYHSYYYSSEEGPPA